MRTGKLVDSGPAKNNAKLISEKEMMEAKIAPDNRLDRTSGKAEIGRVGIRAGTRLCPAAVPPPGVSTWTRSGRRRTETSALSLSSSLDALEQHGRSPVSVTTIVPRSTPRTIRARAEVTRPGQALRAPRSPGLPCDRVCSAAACRRPADPHRRSAALPRTPR